MEKTQTSHSILNFYTKNTDFINIFFIVTISTFVFYNSLNSYLLVDDFFNTVGPPNRNLFNVFITNAYGGNIGGHYRPMESLSHMFDNYFYGYNNYIGRHLTNLILHTMNGIIVYLIASIMTQRKGIGVVAGLLFAVNPIHSQSLPAVAWISGRTDLIVAFFYLLTFLFFLVFSVNKYYISYIASFITFIFALMSKEMAVTLPLIILLYILLNNNKNEVKEVKSYNLIWWTILTSGIFLFIAGIIFNLNIMNNFNYNSAFMQSTVMKSRLLKIGLIVSGLSLILACVLLRSSKRAYRLLLSIRYFIPYFVILIFYIIVRSLVLKGFGGIYKTSGENVLLQLGVDTFTRDMYSLLGIIWPLSDSYNIDVFMFQIRHILLFYFVIMITLAILFYVIYKLTGYSKTLLFYLLWIFITLIPVHNIVITSWGFQPRYLYIPSVGYCIFISILIYSLCMPSLYKNSHLNNIKYITVMAIIFIYIGLNSIFIIRHNENIVKSGNIMRDFVSDIKGSVNKISNKSNIYFITFPLSPIDFSGNVWVTTYMYDILNYADNEIGFKKKYDFNFILFVKGEDSDMINVKKINENVFVIENISYANCYINPKHLSEKEKQIGNIYKMLPPFPLLQGLPSEGNNIEINGGVITVLNINKSTNRAKLQFEILNKLNKYGEDHFYIYKNHRINLLNLS